MRPRLKDVFWERNGAELRIVHNARDQVWLDDPDGVIELLLDLLRKGRRTPPELADVVGVPVATVERIVDVLDRRRLLSDDDRLGRIDADARQRFADNLAFFEPYATLGVSPENFQERVLATHVLIVGLGGANVTSVTQLCGLGVDRLTLVDAATVGARDFARHNLIRRRDLGTRIAQRAAAWIEDVDPSTQVDVVDADVRDGPALGPVLDRYRPDVVLADLDAAGGVDGWLNSACVAAGLPFVRVAVRNAEAVVYSVDPGRSACVACTSSGPATSQSSLAARLLSEPAGGSLRIAPVAGLLGSLATLEVLRYTTGFEPPAYAGQPMLVDIAAGGAMRRLAWWRDPGCAVCGRRDASQLAVA